MTKDIYIIKNDINDKVYIGQAQNTQSRFQKHCVPSASILNNSLIDKAIKCYGKEHFWYEIICSQVDNYDEMEKYYIEKYNSIVPNGYNLREGGEKPPVMKGSDHPESNLTIEEVANLTDDLLNSNLTIAQLVSKYHFKSRTSIHEFNKGITYHREELNYPLRKNLIIGKLTEADVEKIIKYLRTTQRSYSDIGREFNVEYKAISRIDKGLLHKRDDINYPIRGGKNNA